METLKHGMILTQAAAEKVQSLAQSEGVPDLGLRLSVAPGGCAGFRYQLSLDDEVLDGDIREEFFGVGLVTDKMSAPYLDGATIDFVDSIQQVGFTIDNPNASSSCACGDSFH